LFGKSLKPINANKNEKGRCFMARPDTIKDTDAYFVLKPKDNTSFILIEGNKDKKYVSLFKTKELATSYLNNDLEIDFIEDIYTKLKIFNLDVIKYMDGTGIYVFDFKDLIPATNDMSKFLTNASYFFEHNIEDEDLLNDIYSNFLKTKFYINKNIYFKTNEEDFSLIFTSLDEVPEQFKPYDKFECIEAVDALAYAWKCRQGILVNPSTLKFIVSWKDLRKFLEASIKENGFDYTYKSMIAKNENFLENESLEVIATLYNSIGKDDEDIIGKILANFERKLIQEDEFLIPLAQSNKCVFEVDIPSNMMEMKGTRTNLAGMLNIIYNAYINMTDYIDFKIGGNCLRLKIKDAITNLTLKAIEYNPDIVLELNDKLVLRNVGWNLKSNEALNYIMGNVVYLLVNREKNTYASAKNGLMVVYSDKGIIPDEYKETYSIMELTPYSFSIFLSNMAKLSIIHVSKTRPVIINKHLLISAYLKLCLVQNDIETFNKFGVADYFYALEGLDNEGYKEKVLRQFYSKLEKFYILYNNVQNRIVKNDLGNGRMQIICSMEQFQAKPNYNLRLFSFNDFLGLVEMEKIDELQFLTIEDRYITINTQQFIKEYSKQKIYINILDYCKKQKLPIKDVQDLLDDENLKVAKEFNQFINVGEYPTNLNINGYTSKDISKIIDKSPIEVFNTMIDLKKKNVTDRTKALLGSQDINI
jgi:hypothetical protein